MKFYKPFFAITSVVCGILIIGGFHFTEIFGTALRGRQAFVIGALIFAIFAALADIVGHYFKFNAKDKRTGKLKNPPACHDYIIIVGKGLAAIGIIALIMSRAEDISGVDKDAFARSQKEQVQQLPASPTLPAAR